MATDELINDSHAIHWNIQNGCASRRATQCDWLSISPWTNSIKIAAEYLPDTDTHQPRPWYSVTAAKDFHGDGYGIRSTDTLWNSEYSPPEDRYLTDLLFAAETLPTETDTGRCLATENQNADVRAVSAYQAACQAALKRRKVPRKVEPCQIDCIRVIVSERRGG